MDLPPARVTVFAGASQPGRRGHIPPVVKKTEYRLPGAVTLRAFGGEVVHLAEVPDVYVPERAAGWLSAWLSRKRGALTHQF